ncbi:hypothetical protein ACTFIY_012381 [Dictyostelium cf. discoideum]
MSQNIDPFYLMEKSVSESIINIKKIYNKWYSLLNETNTFSNKEFKFYTKEINKMINDIEIDLNDISSSIKIIENNNKNEKFKNIPKKEIQRNQFLKESTNEINNIKIKLSNEEVIKKINNDKLKNQEFNNKNYNNNINNNNKSNNYTNYIKHQNEIKDTEFLNEQIEYKKSLMDKQDKELGYLLGDVKTMHEISLEIQKELEIQNIILGNLNDRADQSLFSINSVMRQLDRFKESWFK